MKLLQILKEMISERNAQTPENVYELYNFGDREQPPYSRFDTARESEELEEGPNDPNIFKAVFMAGGPGSGKSFIAEKLGLQAKGLKTVNSDEALEFLMRKRKLSLAMPPEEQGERDVARQRAKEITRTRMDRYVDGRLGLVIDGTAKDVNKIFKIKAYLETIGYDTMMVFVDTSLETALKRNRERPRQVPEDVLVASHEDTQANKRNLNDLFGRDFTEVVNEPPLDLEAAQKRVYTFLRTPIGVHAKRWVDNQRKKEK